MAIQGQMLYTTKAGEKCDADEQCISGDCDGHAFGLFFGKCDSKVKTEETAILCLRVRLLLCNSLQMILQAWYN